MATDLYIVCLKDKGARNCAKGVWGTIHRGDDTGTESCMMRNHGGIFYSERVACAKAWRWNKHAPCGRAPQESLRLEQSAWKKEVRDEL